MKYLFGFLVTVLSLISTAQEARISGDYKKYGLNESNVPEKWEDGIRTGGAAGTYEWWYFDAQLEDGSKVVVIFYTKPFVKINKGLKPMITIEIERPDEEKYETAIIGESGDFEASKDSCHVRIGKNFFRGNLEQYVIHVENEELTMDIELERKTQSWRPKTGHLEYGQEGDYFAWLVPVPKGEANIHYQLNGERHIASGSGYHDHNWGNISLIDVMNHWYWSRSEVGPYTVIAVEMISHADYEFQSIPVFYVAKDGETIADRGELSSLYRSETSMHPTLKKDVSNDLLFVYQNEEIRIEYGLERKKMMLEIELLKLALGDGLKFKLVNALVPFDGAYFRFTGDAELSIYENEQLTDQQKSEKAVWELMYFGKPFE